MHVSAPELFMCVNMCGIVHVEETSGVHVTVDMYLT